MCEERKGYIKSPTSSSSPTGSFKRASFNAVKFLAAASSPAQAVNCVSSICLSPGGTPFRRAHSSFPILVTCSNKRSTLTPALSIPFTSSRVPKSKSNDPSSRTKAFAGCETRGSEMKQNHLEDRLELFLLPTNIVCNLSKTYSSLLLFAQPRNLLRSTLNGSLQNSSDADKA